MGRKKKYGVESAIECFRVPKGKKKEYRKAINKFIEGKFEKDLNSEDLEDDKAESVSLSE